MEAVEICLVGTVSCIVPLFIQAKVISSSLLGACKVADKNEDGEKKQYQS